MAGLQGDSAIPAGLAEEKRNEFSQEKGYDEASVASSGGLYENDGIHDGLIAPTQEERDTLRRVPDTVPWNAYLIAIIEMAERFSFYGSSVVFTNFIQQPLPKGSHTGAGGPDGQSGALGMGQQASTGLTTFYQFWCYITPLYGAYVADTYLGRFNTISYSVFIAMIGHIILIVSALPGVIESQKGATAAFVISLIVIGVGTGGFKSNISPLVAEQYQRTKPFVVTRKNGERVIVDPALTISKIYMYFYLFINIGALIGQITMTYCEKYVGFWLAYTLPTVVFFLSPIVLLVGRKRYVRSPPAGSVLGSAIRYWFLCAKGRWSMNPVTTWKQLNADGFWESAKPSRLGANKPAWMTFDDVWADEVKRGLKACAVFLWYPLWWLTYNQLNNNLTSQAATMDTHGLPNDVLSNLDPFALLIFIPICDLLIYPGLRRIGINFTPLKRIAFGFWTGALSMVWATVLQYYIYKTSPCGKMASTCKETSPLNVWIQTGSYILIAFSEIFASITGLEYAFTKAPKNMRSLVMSVFLFMSAISSALGEAFVSLSTDPLLEWNYGVMGCLSAFAGTVFWFVTRKLDHQEDELNQLKEGHVDATKPEESH